jgi:uncharacterized membrane protein
MAGPQEATATELPQAETTASELPAGRLSRVSFNVGVLNLAVALAAAATSYAAGYPLRPSYTDPWIVIGASAWMVVFITAYVGASAAAAGFVALAQRQPPRASAVAAVVTGLIPSLFTLVVAFIIPYLC